MPGIEVRVFRNADGTCDFNEWVLLLKKRQRRGYAKCVFLVGALTKLGTEIKMPLSKPLRDGIHELRGQVGTVNYRPLYSLISPGVALITHGITKEGEVPSEQIDLAAERVKLAKKNPDKYTTEFEK